RSARPPGVFAARLGLRRVEQACCGEAGIVTRALLELGKWPAQHVVELGAGAALVIVSLLVWRLAWPCSFARVVSRPVRGVWRGWWVYRLGWAKSMWLCGLAVRDRPTFEYSQVGPGGKRKVQMLHPKIGAGMRCRQ